MNRIPVAFLASLALAASSAWARDTSLNVDDSSWVPMLRMEMAPASNGPASAPHGGVAFELTYLQASGGSTQDIGGGQTISAGGAPLLGPRQISNDATQRELDAFVRWRSGGNPWLFELLGGLSFVHYEFSAGSVNTSGTPTAAVIGAGGLWRVRPQTTLQARYLLGKGISSYTQDIALDRLELAVVQSLGPTFSARLGYMVSDTTISPTEPNSELHMRFRGPMLGIDFHF